MVASARLLTSVEPDQRQRFSELAAAQGVSSSRLLARLVHRALVENPEAKVKRLLEEAAAGKAPAEKYTVRLMGLDAARLESRAQARGVTVSGYVAHLLRAHLRADPPMPYGEFQELKRVVSELAGIRAAMAQLASRDGTTQGLEPSLKENVSRLLPALKQIRERVQDMLISNSSPGKRPMPSKRPFRVTRDVPGGITPGSYGRKGGREGQSPAGWAERMGSSGRGAKEVLVKISGGGRDADGVQAHFEYIDRHGKLDIETDHGDVLQGKTAAKEIISDWALDYGTVPGAPHSRSKVGADGKRRQTRQAFNIVLSMPAGTPPEKVLKAVKKFAREEFAHQHRYAMALHSEEKGKHGMHPHVHLVVKAEHEYDGSRLNPRKADLQRWRERFAEYLAELGVAATATRREDWGFVKTNKKTPIYRAAQRQRQNPANPLQTAMLTTTAGDSVFMRIKFEMVKRELRTRGTVADRDAYRSLMNVRAKVNERYGEAIHWLRRQGREDEARRFELLQRNLPPVHSEKQLIADALFAQQKIGKGKDNEQGRAR